MRTSGLRPRGGKRLGAVLATVALLLGAAAPSAASAAEEDLSPYTIWFNNFESGRLAPWAPSGGSVTVERQTIPESIGLSHATSMRVAGRAATGEGAALPLADYLTAGERSTISVWTRLHPGTPATTVRVGVEQGGTVVPVASGAATADGWIEIVGDYTPAAGAELGRLLITADAADAGFWVDDTLLTGYAPRTVVIDDSTPLKSTLPFPIGAAGDSRIAAGSGEPTLSTHFNSVSAENHMKPEAWYNADGSFVSTNPQADSLADWAVENDGRVFGHVLLWHSQIPAWFFRETAGDNTSRELTNSDADKAILTERIRTHIDNVAEYFADRYGPYGSAGNPMKAWEVVNEVINDGQNPQLRNSRFFQILGEEFIDIAFHAADESFNETYAAEGVDHPVELFINEYGTEGGASATSKLQRYYDLVVRLLERDVPITGVGHQFHTTMASLNLANMEAALEKFAGLGLVHAVTEFDIAIGTVTERNLIRQGHITAQAFDIFKEFHAGPETMYSVTVWGLRDMGSWRYYDGAPLLFDDYFNGKWAYRGAAGLSIPAEPRAMNAFGGTVELTEDAVTDVAWDQLAPTPIADRHAFGLRWSPDHVTALVEIADTDADATDAVTFTLGGDTYTVGRDGSGDIDAITGETAEGWRLVAHVPTAGLAEGDIVRFDVAVDDGDAVLGWNDAGVLGEVTLREPLSFAAITEIANAPTIDGDIDAAWADAVGIATGKQIDGTDSASADVRLAWNGDGDTLFLLAEVQDDVIDTSAGAAHERDSIEVFLDLGNRKNGTYLATDMQLRINAAGELSFGSGDAAAQQARVTSAVQVVDGGYVVEAAISLLDAGGAESLHGFDVQVNDARDGARVGVRNWADPTGSSWNNTSRWGVIQLAVDEGDVAPTPKPTPDPEPTPAPEPTPDPEPTTPAPVPGDGGSDDDDPASGGTGGNDGDGALAVTGLAGSFLLPLLAGGALLAAGGAFVVRGIRRSRAGLS